jgi:hypothetical protein
MKDILKSFGVGAAVASALIGGTYLAARLIDAAEIGLKKFEKPEETPAK